MIAGLCGALLPLVAFNIAQAETATTTTAQRYYYSNVVTVLEYRADVCPSVESTILLDNLTVLTSMLTHKINGTVPPKIHN